MWQPETFELVKRTLGENPAVKQVVLLGSLANEQAGDKWSDLDIGIVVEKNTLNSFYPSLTWIRPFGEIYASNQSVASQKVTSRIVMTDGRRLDFSITLDQGLLSTDPPGVSIEDQVASLANLNNDFKFEAFLAVTKLARNDLLIGLHLILELERKCLVLAMMLRDRDAGTVHHPHGGPYNEVVKELRAFGGARNELLDRLESAAKLYDVLATQLSPSSSVDWTPLGNYVLEVRAITAKQSSQP